MVLSPLFRKDVKFLSTVIPSENSVKFDKNHQNIIPDEKRTKFYNFICRVIERISCSRIPCNSKLDEVTRWILFEARDLKTVIHLSSQDKIILKKAFKNLSEIIKKNGGSNYAKVVKLIGVVKGIPTFDRVMAAAEMPKQLFGADKVDAAPPDNSPQQLIQKNEALKPKDEDVRFEEPPKYVRDEIPIPMDDKRVVLQAQHFKEDKKLGILLKNLKEKNVEIDYAVQEVSRVLLEIEDSNELSEDAVPYLCKILAQISHEWIEKNAKNLSPVIIKFLVEKSFQGNSNYFVSNLFNALIHESVDKKRLHSLVRAFPTLNEKELPLGSYEEKKGDVQAMQRQLQGDIMHWIRVTNQLLYDVLSKNTIAILEKNLSPKILKSFIHNFFGLIALDHREIVEWKYFHKTFFKISMDQMNNFAIENRKVLLNALCYARSAYALAKMLISCNAEDDVLGRILKLNPAEQPFDDFFHFFILTAFKGGQFPLQDKTIDYILKHEPFHRKEILFNHLSANLRTQSIEDIPFEFLKKTHYQNLLEMARCANKMHDPYKKKQACQIVCKALEENINDKFHKNEMAQERAFDEKVCPSLLPFFSVPVQQSILSKALTKMLEGKAKEKEEAKNILMAAEDLPFAQLEEASRKIKDLKFQVNLTDLLPEQLAAIANGQIHNHQFLYDFFNYFFSEDAFDAQKKILEHLNPEVFQFNLPHQLKEQTWRQVFKMIGYCPETEHTQHILENAAIHLFNHFDPKENDVVVFMDMLGSSQWRSLTLENFNHEICLIRAFEDHTLLNYTATIKALKGQQIQSFMELFKQYYMKEKDFFGKHTYPVVDFALMIQDMNQDLFEACLEKIREDKDIPVEDRIKLIKKLPLNIIRSHILPYAVHLYDELLELHEVLEQVQARKLIEQHWEKLIQTAQDPEKLQVFPFASILKYTNESEKLKQLLKLPFDEHYIKKLVDKDKSYLNHIFDHLDQHPWKLSLLLDDKHFNSFSLREWVSGTYPKCYEVLKQIKASQQEVAFVNNIFQDIFQLVEKNVYEEAVKKYNELQNMTIAKSLKYAYLKNCQELSSMHEGEIFILSLNKDLNAQIDKTLQAALPKNNISYETYKRLQEIRQAAGKYLKF